MATRSLRSTLLRHVSCAALATSFVASQASASPVLLAGDGTEKVHSTHVTLLSSGGTNVVTILPDYQGALSPFAVIVPVPADVTPARVNTLKREFVDRIETISAPRFAEFWEMDACEPGKAAQEWERDLTVGSAPGIMGGAPPEATVKVAKELLLDVNAQTKQGEYKLNVLDSADAVKSWLSGKNLTLPTGGSESLIEYAGKGYKFLVAEVDVNRLELVGGDRAQLSPLRYWTNEDASHIAARFGLPSIAAAHELFVYPLVPEQRMQVTNYPTKAAPTNLTIDFAAKERMGEFYTGLYDRFAEKSPGTFLLEYAYSTADCGKPCPTDPLLPSELMSLGGDVIDAKLPKSELRPKPPEPTEDEKAVLEATLAALSGKEKADAKREWQEQRDELAARRALLARQMYVLSRLHYRYGKTQLPLDPQLGPGGPVKGGTALPLGKDGAADPAVAGGEQNEFQVRYNSLHPSISKTTCDSPESSRWGRAPKTYRGTKKIWAATDLSRKNRKQIKLEDTLISPSADLGFAGKAAPAAPAPPAKAVPEQKKDGFCSYAHAPRASGWPALVAIALTLGAWSRRRLGRA